MSDRSDDHFVFERLDETNDGHAIGEQLVEGTPVCDDTLTAGSTQLADDALTAGSTQLADDALAGDALVADELADDALVAEGAQLAEGTQVDVPAVSRKTAKPRIRTKRNRPRSKTIALKRLTRDELRRGALANPPIEGIERPIQRSECKDGPRPCPWVACKHHLYLDINPRTGSIKINFPDLEPWELQHTCALDVADAGALTLEEIGIITNLTRERVRQVEVRGLLTLQARSNSLR